MPDHGQGAGPAGRRDPRPARPRLPLGPAQPRGHGTGPARRPPTPRVLARRAERHRGRRRAQRLRRRDRVPHRAPRRPRARPANLRVGGPRARRPDGQAAALPHGGAGRGPRTLDAPRRHPRRPRPAPGPADLPLCAQADAGAPGQGAGRRGHRPDRRARAAARARRPVAGSGGRAAGHRARPRAGDRAGGQRRRARPPRRVPAGVRPPQAPPVAAGLRGRLAHGVRRRPGDPEDQPPAAGPHRLRGHLGVRDQAARRHRRAVPHRDQRAGAGQLRPVAGVRGGRAVAALRHARRPAPRTAARPDRRAQGDAPAQGGRRRGRADAGAADDAARGRAQLAGHPGHRRPRPARPSRCWPSSRARWPVAASALPRRSRPGTPAGSTRP